MAIMSTVRLSEFHILKETPKGYWIDDPYRAKRFVLKEGKKRYAYPTKKLALESLNARTKRRKSILTTQLKVCDTGLKIVHERLKEYSQSNDRT